MFLKIINVLLLLVNPIAIYYSFSGAKNISTNAAGLIVLIVLLYVLGYVFHLVAFTVAVIYQKKWFLIILTIVAGIASLWLWLQAAAPTIAAWQQKIFFQSQEENFRQGVGVFEPGEPTMFAKSIAQNDAPAIRKLITGGAKVQDAYLSYAIALPLRQVPISLEVFQLLLNHGANPSSSNPYENYYSQLRILSDTYPCNQYAVEVLEVFLQTGAKPITDNSPYLIHPCREKLIRFLAHGVELNLKGKPSIEGYLYPLDVDKLQHDFWDVSWTWVMHYAAHYPQYLEETKYLLGEGADVAYQDENGVSLKTILQYVLQKNYPENPQLIPGQTSADRTQTEQFRQQLLRLIELVEQKEKP